MLHEPAPFHLDPPEVEHVGTQPERGAEGVKQQVYNLESPPGGENLVKFIRESEKHGEVKDGNELPARELPPPQQRPRQ